MTRIHRLHPFTKYIYLGAFLIVTAVIFVFSLTNGTDSTQQSNFFRDIVVNSLGFFGLTLSPDQVDLIGLLIRKLIGHLGIFAVDGWFGFLMFYHFLKTKTRISHALIFSLGIMLLIAFTSEGMQFLVPDRGLRLLTLPSIFPER